MAVEDGREYNPETARDLRERVFRFDAYGVTFQYILQIPAYILDRIKDSAISCRIDQYMNGYAAEVVTRAMRGGYVHTEQGERRMRADIGQHLKNYIWERFSITQEKAGNDCWETAPTLQEVLR